MECLKPNKLEDFSSYVERLPLVGGIKIKQKLKGSEYIEFKEYNFQFQ